ncbi:MAG: sensor histidine kinase, partial [Limisphaerales bacterium]
MADRPVSASNTPALSVYQVPLDAAQESGSEIGATDLVEWNEPLLRQNAIWFCQLRWIVVAVLTAVGVAGFFPAVLAAVGLAIPPGWPLGTAAVLVGLNAGFKYLVVTGGRRRFPGVRLWLWMQIVSDLLILTAVVHWVGRDLPAAPFMYLFHVILAAIVFSSGESLVVAGLAAAFYLSSLALESAGVLTPTSLLAGVDRSSAGAASAGRLTALVVPMLLIWAVIWYLASRLAATVRRRDRELAVSNRRLEASSEERARHMLQTTHQLKAPFAAIHAQAQLLQGGYCGELPAAARAVVEKISARCLALSRQIQEMLQLANLRSQGQMAPPRCEIDLAAAIEEAVARSEPAAGRRGIRLERQLEPVTLVAVADHL